MPPVIPSADGVPFTLLPDFQNKHNANQTYAVLAPTSANASLAKVTFHDFYEAINRAAHLVNPLAPNGVPGLSGKVIAVLAVTDNLVYQTLVMGIIRSGNIAIPISNRNSTAAVVNLLRKTDCHHIIVGGTAVAPLVENTRADLDRDGFNISIVDVPAATYLFPSLGSTPVTKVPDASAAYPVPAGVNSLDAVRMYIHSSGTTSLPKPIPLTERYMRSVSECAFVQSSKKMKLLGVMASPPFHAIGAIIQFIGPLYTAAPVAFWNIAAEHTTPPVPTPSNTIDALIRTGCTSTLISPNFLVEWAHSEKAVTYLQQMDHVSTGGGPLPGEVGDFLVAQGVNVVSVYGGTEFAAPTVVDRVVGTTEEWAYLEFSSQMRLNWSPNVIGDEVYYELQVLSNERFQPAVLNSETPFGPAYSTNDLFLPHPTKKGLWKVVGRLDDQVTLATGEKVNPGPIELHLAESPLVLGAVVIGRAKNQIGVIVEPKPGFEVDLTDHEALANFRNLIWPTVEAANRQSAGFARIFKEAIIPTVPHKPLPRTPKGSVQRKRAVEIYAEEIENMYAAIERAKGGDNIVPPASWSTRDLESWLKAAAEELLEHPVQVDNDIFDQGADSLTATFLRNRIIGVLRKSSDASVASKASELDADIVFTHPTVVSLANHVSVVVGASGSTALDPIEQKLRDMSALIEKYASDTPSTPLSKREIPQTETVLVTGTTGALGSLMLAKLLCDERIERVWALNRSSKGKTLLERQKEAFVDKALDISLLEHPKLQLVEADLTQERLGLPEHRYDEMRSTTTLVIHNAWRLDFNLSLMSFESNIKGTRHLVDLVLASPHASDVRFIFISSVGALHGWEDATVPVPEEPISDPRIAVSNGYGESKYVTEKILEAISQNTGLATTSIRVGQLSGSKNGFWSATDWVPIFIASSVHLGCLPDARGVASWIPLDGAASSVLEVGLARHAVVQGTVHLYHPRPIAWSTVIGAAADALEPLTNNARLPVVSWTDWFARLHMKSRNPEDMLKIPALKLLPFYRALAAGDARMRLLDEKEGSEREAMGFVKLSTDKMQALSPTLRDLREIDEDEVKRWIAYWQSKGLFG